MSAAERRSLGFGQWLDRAASLAVLVACAILVWKVFFSGPPAAPPAGATSPAAPIPTSPISIEGAPIKGSRAARIAIVQFSEFECPYCGQFARELLPALEQKYIASGTALLAFRHLPLGMHRFAQKAAEAAECASRQDRFWELHDKFFADPGRGAIREPERTAGTLGMDQVQFRRCLAGEATARITDDTNQAEALGITATPTFVIGRLSGDGRVAVVARIAGAQPGQLDKVIDSLIRN